MPAEMCSVVCCHVHLWRARRGEIGCGAVRCGAMLCGAVRSRFYTCDTFLRL